MPTDWNLSISFTIQSFNVEQSCSIIRVSNGKDDQRAPEDRLVLLVIDSMHRIFQVYSSKFTDSEGFRGQFPIIEGETYLVDITKTYEGIQGDENKWKLIAKHNGSGFVNEEESGVQCHNDMKVFTSWRAFQPCNVEIKSLDFQVSSAGKT